MANKGLPQQHLDNSGLIKAPNDDHAHPINRKVHPGTAKSSDFVPGGPDVPARAALPLTNPDTKQRRA
jgi:hypothetical protein